MNKWLALPDVTKKNAYVQIGENIGMAAFAVEKDWWVVQTLACIFEMEVARHIVFKGGTSLSKAWKLIQRFSEDIDLAIDRTFFGYNGNLNRGQLTALRRRAGAFTTGPFMEELKTKFEEHGLEGVTWNVVGADARDQDPRILEVYYPNVIDVPGYLQPRVQIEIGCRSLREPYTDRSFSSLVDEEYADRDFAQEPITVPTVNAERTFIEKIFLLHEEFHKPADIRVDRLSRHLYDVYHLSQTEFLDIVLNSPDLYASIVDHRYHFVRIGGVNYNLHQPQSINPLPVPTVNEAYKADYARMREEMIYEENPPSYEELIRGLTNLRERLNALTWRFETVYPER